MNELSERLAKYDPTGTFSRGLIRGVTGDKISYYEHAIKKIREKIL